MWIWKRTLIVWFNSCCGTSEQDLILSIDKSAFIKTNKINKSKMMKP